MNAYYSGIELGEMLREKNEKCKIVYLTSHPNKAITVINRKITPSGYLIKEFTYEKKKHPKLLIERKRKLSCSTCYEKGGQPSVMVIAITISITMKSFYLMSMPGYKNKIGLVLKDEEILVNGTIKKYKNHSNMSIYVKI